MFENECEFNKNIGKNIKKYRLAYNKGTRKMTQEKLAKKIGISRSTIAALENSNINIGISIYKLYKISEVFNVSIDDLVE